MLPNALNCKMGKCHGNNARSKSCTFIFAASKKSGSELRKDACLKNKRRLYTFSTTLYTPRKSMVTPGRFRLRNDRMLRP